MKRIMMGFAVLVLLISNYAYAEIYTYTGQDFVNTYGTYTTSMRVTGTITTSGPIPPSSSNYDISGILTSWSFNDGMQTISSANGELYPSEPPKVSTDGSGNITSASFRAFSSPMATVEDDLDNRISVENHDEGWKDAVCTEAENGTCNAWKVPNRGIANSGVWETVKPPSPPIPTLSQWSLMLLALMLGMVGIARVRRQA